jgi:hypothetical protein
MKLSSIKKPTGFYAKLAERAHEVGRVVARKANGGVAYDTTWHNVNPSGRKGFVALVKFIAKELRKEP